MGADDPDFEDELPMLLPNPINQEQFEFTRNFHATQGLQILPWAMYSQMTVVIFFMWVIAFGWSIANAVTDFDAPKWELTDYYKFWYVQEVPERRLSVSSVVVPCNSSSVHDVANWLDSMGYIEVADKAQEAQVDGFALHAL